MHFDSGTMSANRPVGTLPTVKRKTFEYYHFYAMATSNVLEKDRVSQSMISKALYNHYEFYKYKFDLDRLLRLNVTLLDVYFSSSSWNYCEHGSISIGNQLPCGEYHLRYCGVYPQITSFPDSHKVKTEVYAKFLTTVKVRMFYSIIDSNKILSLPPVLKQKAPFPLWNMLLTTQAQLLNVYKVLVEHFKQLEISLTHKRQGLIDIYNGPGTKSPKLSGKSIDAQLTKYFASSFQVTLYHVENVYKFQNSGSALHFTARLTECWTAKFVDRPTFFQTSNICTFCPVCVVKLTQTKQLGMQVTFGNVTYEGEANTENCSYAGVAIYEATEVSFSRALTECFKKHLGMRFKMLWKKTTEFPYVFKGFIKIYSALSFSYTKPDKKENISHFLSGGSLLIFYSFKEYGLMSFKAGVSPVLCKVITIHACFENEARTHQVFTNVWHSPCTVLQFKFTSRNSAGYCHSAFAVEPNKECGKVLSLHSTGNFRGEAKENMLVISLTGFGFSFDSTEFIFCI